MAAIYSIDNFIKLMVKPSSQRRSNEQTPVFFRLHNTSYLELIQYPTSQYKKIS